MAVGPVVSATRARFHRGVYAPLNGRASAERAARVGAAPAAVVDLVEGRDLRRLAPAIAGTHATSRPCARQPIHAALIAPEPGKMSTRSSSGSRPSASNTYSLTARGLAPVKPL